MSLNIQSFVSNSQLCNFSFQDDAFLEANALRVFQDTQLFQNVVSTHGVEKILDLLRIAIERKGMQSKYFCHFLYDLGGKIGSQDLDHITNCAAQMYMNYNMCQLLDDSERLLYYLSSENLDALCRYCLNTNPQNLLYNKYIVLLWAYKGSDSYFDYDAELDTDILKRLLLFKLQQDGSSRLGEALCVFCSSSSQKVCKQFLTFFLMCPALTEQDILGVLEADTDINKTLFFLLLRSAPEQIFSSKFCINNLYWFFPLSDEQIVQCLTVIPDSICHVLNVLPEETIRRVLLQVDIDVLLKIAPHASGFPKNMIFDLLIDLAPHLLLEKETCLSQVQRDRLYQKMIQLDPQKLIPHITDHIDVTKDFDYLRSKIFCELVIEFDKHVDAWNGCACKLNICTQIAFFLKDASDKEIEELRKKPQHMQITLMLLARLSPYTADMPALMSVCTHRRFKDHKELKVILCEALSLIADDRVSRERKMQLMHYITENVKKQDRPSNKMDILVKIAKEVSFIGSLPGGLDRLAEIVDGGVGLVASLATPVLLPVLSEESWRQYASSFGTWKDPYAVLRYIKNISDKRAQLSEGEQATLIDASRKFIEAVCGGDEAWRRMRAHNTEHMAAVEKATSRALLEHWREGDRAPLCDLISLPEKGKYAGMEIADVDDAETLFLAPTLIPTCQSVDNKDVKLTKCLLGYALDPKNRFLIATDEDGRLIARAVIKLLMDGDGRAVLFLECPYPYVRSPIVDQALIGMAKRRAETLGVPLHISQHLLPQDSQNIKLVSLASPSYEYCDSVPGAGEALYRGVTNGQYTIFL